MRGDVLSWWYKKKSRKTSDCSSLFPPYGATTHSLELFLKKKKLCKSTILAPEQMGIMNLEVNLGCYLDVEFLLTKALDSPTNTLVHHSLQELFATVSALNNGCLRRWVGMTVLFIAKKSWAGNSIFNLLEKNSYYWRFHFPQVFISFKCQMLKNCEFQGL